MKLKKFSSVLISCILAGTLFTGCGSNEQEKIQPSKIGVIAKLNETESTFNQHSNQLEQSIKIPGLKISHQYIYYKDMDSLLSALKSKNIDEITTYRSVANYIIAKNPSWEISNHTVSMSDSICLAVRKDNIALLDSLNIALKAMETEGTTSYIVKTYVYYLNPNDETPIADMPVIDGAETIKVGVTGDLPPLDLINSEGKPAGFSTTFLAELSRRTKKNIEIVKISADERATALTSNKIDVAFWITIPNDDLKKSGSFVQSSDKPADLEVTIPYFEDEIVHVVSKK